MTSNDGVEANVIAMLGGLPGCERLTPDLLRPNVFLFSCGLRITAAFLGRALVVEEIIHEGM